jgi:glycosyltransferase involved in cell wall biosynthesis
MRILMLSPYVPWQVHGGGAIRIFNLLKELVQLGHQVVLYAGEGDPDLSSDRHYDSLCEEVHTYRLPAPGRLTSALLSLFSPLPYGAAKLHINELRRTFPPRLQGQRFDLIWANVLYLAGALPPELRVGAKVVMDESESDEMVWEGYSQQGSWPERLFARLNLRKVKRFEKRILPGLAAVFCVSEKESARMQGKVDGGTKVWTVPNGVDVEYFPRIPLSQRSANYILLGGIMNFRRNIDAAIWFTQRMFPRVRASIPDAQLWIVGASPNREVLQLQEIPGVHVTGTVKDTRDYFAKASVLVAPYRFGAGTRLKMLEGMATGTPIVATRGGCQGIEAVDRQHLLLADDEAEFADRVIELLRSRELAERLAAASRMLVEEKYSWRKIVGGLEPKLQDLLGRN